MKTRYLTLTAALLISAGAAVAHGDEDHGQAQTPALKPVAGAHESVAAQRLADGSLFIPKTVQHQLGLRTVLSAIAAVPATLALNGKIIADPNSAGRVQASQPGRVEAARQGLPVLGQKVKQGQLLAYLRPLAGSIERGNSQAQLAEIEAQQAIAERKLQRYQQLEGALPQASIEAARLELDALRKRRDAVGASLHAPDALLAPVSGIISAAYAVTGQVVDSKEILFEVVDPDRLAVEALAYEPALATGIASASAAIAGGNLELDFVGAGRQLREQALPLLFRIQPGHAAVAVGQSVKLIAKTSRSTKGAAVPLAALVKQGAGETAVWIHTEAERFVLRKVKTEALDAVTVVITAGVADGERVVTAGASLLAQVR